MRLTTTPSREVAQNLTSTSSIERRRKYILQRTKKVPMNEMGRAAQILRREMSIGMNPPSLHYVPAPHPVLCPLPLPWIYNLAE